MPCWRTDLGGYSSRPLRTEAVFSLVFASVCWVASVTVVHPNIRHAGPPVRDDSVVALTPELIARIERAVGTYGSGRAIPAGELRDGLRELDLEPDADYADFVGRWGGCFVGVSVHAWDNASLLGKETCVQLTTWAREAHGSLIDGLVFADDGSGNPIWIAADGRVRLVDHDNGDEVTLAPGFAALLADNVHD
jgi:hypothetical protein